MYENIKKLLFLLEPEDAHALIEKTLRFNANYLPFILKYIYKKYEVNDDALKLNILGKNFKNPIGLAAGFDKNASMLNGLRALGFSHIEYGTLTPKPQSGNEKPRLFRYKKQNSLQNAMGFNNHGVNEAIKNLQNVHFLDLVLGASIGKNKDSENALDDYSILIQNLDKYCNYFAINISSPNTKGLRDLQNEEFIKELLHVSKMHTKKPIFIKLAPDMDIQNALNLCQVAYENQASGIIATNTTTNYSLLSNAKDFGGISGEALKEVSFEFFKCIAKDFYDKLTLICVGGIDSGYEAYKRIKLGASLVQIYTSLVYKGPSLVKKMNEDLLFLLKKDGFNNINEAIGTHWKNNN